MGRHVRKRHDADDGDSSDERDDRSQLDHSNLRGADLQGRHLQSLGKSGQRYINAAAGELDLRSSELRRSRSNPVAAVFHRRRRQQSAAAGAGWRHRLSAVSVPGPGSVGRGVPNGARRRRGPKAFPSGSYDLVRLNRVPGWRDQILQYRSGCRTRRRSRRRAHGVNNMSTMLFFLVPLGMLTVAWSVCFVGCALNTHGQGEPTPYSDTIVDEPGLLAYWPLNDLLNPISTTGTTAKARDLSGQGRDGTLTIPPPYPSGAQAVAKSQLLNPPTLARGNSIVAGDAGSLVNALPASTDFEGGIVSIPWSTQSWPPLSEFTIEAWIQPKWSGT